MTMLKYAIANKIPCAELTIQDQSAEIERLQAEVNRLRYALEFYADPPFDSWGDACTTVARKALGRR